MTDARLPERWLMDRRIQRLSDGHYRAYINALMYAVANRSDGVVEPEDLGLIPGFAAGAAKVFVDSGLWTPRAPKGWLISDYEATQSSRDDLERLERMRASDRRKKQQKRSRPADGPGDNQGDGPGDASPGTQQAGRKAGRKAGHEGADLSLAAGAEHPRWRGAGPDPFDEYK